MWEGVKNFKVFRGINRFVIKEIQERVLKIAAFALQRFSFKSKCFSEGMFLHGGFSLLQSEYPLCCIFLDYF